MNDIGIMQGRLSPPHSERLQAFPWSSWEQEFQHAANLGYDVIEWQFDADRYEQNPILTQKGLDRIQKQIETTGVRVKSVCADYFMVHPFFRVSEEERMRSVVVLKQLIMQALQLGVRSILLPVLEVAEIRSAEEKKELLNSLREPLVVAEENGICLGLETELLAAEYLELIEQGGHPALGVYYDIGNATACGYSIAEDIRHLGRFLCGVHLKDRKLGGPSVLLGQGDVDFQDFFHVLSDIKYGCPLVLQTAFGTDYLGVARRHLAFVKDHLVRTAMDSDSIREVSE